MAASLGILTREQAEALRDMGVHRYNHNLETARSCFLWQVVTTHSWQKTLGHPADDRGVRPEVCCGGIVGMGESLEQRAGFAAQLAELGLRGAAELLQSATRNPFLRHGRVAGRRRSANDRGVPVGLPARSCDTPADADPGRPGTRDGLLGGINAVIVAPLTTLGRTRRLRPRYVVRTEHADQGTVRLL